MICPRSTRRCATIRLERDGVCFRNIIDGKGIRSDGIDNDGVLECRQEWMFTFRGISCSYVENELKEKENNMRVTFYAEDILNGERREAMIRTPRSWSPRMFLILTLEEGRKSSLVFSIVVNNILGRLDICNVVKKYATYKDKELQKIVYHSDFYIAINGNI